MSSQIFLTEFQTLYTSNAINKIHITDILDISLWIKVYIKKGRFISKARGESSNVKTFQFFLQK